MAKMSLPKMSKPGDMITKMNMSKAPADYHARAQNFINSSKSMGYGVQAEGSELIAYPPNRTPVVKNPLRYR